MSNVTSNCLRGPPGSEQQETAPVPSEEEPQWSWQSSEVLSYCDSSH